MIKVVWPVVFAALLMAACAPGPGLQMTLRTTGNHELLSGVEGFTITLEGCTLEANEFVNVALLYGDPGGGLANAVQLTGGAGNIAYKATSTGTHISVPTMVIPVGKAFGVGLDRPVAVDVRCQVVTYRPATATD
jgi:hypothetical protein